MNEYIYYTNLLNKKNSTLLVGIDSAMLRLNTAAGKGYMFS